jgi:hypothetical protein
VTIPEENSDEELANLMADNENVDGAESGVDDESGTVEAGIPPQLDDSSPEVDSSEESFSINDFEEDFQPQSNQSDVGVEGEAPDEVVKKSEQEIVDSSAEKPEDTFIESPAIPVSKTNGDGDVAQFRQTLASLSRQLELDRLAFLHKSLQDSGEILPSLNEIASDISGEKLLKPTGDYDLFGKRPAARLDGWLSGLSFGVNKRAKKFSK